MKLGAYIAAINRAKYIIENFQTTPSIKPALLVMAKGYEKLNLTDLAQDAKRVYALNYGN